MDKSFEFGLREIGYTVGQNIAIEYRWTEGKSELLASLTRELIALNVDVIVTAGTDSIRVVKRGDHQYSYRDGSQSGCGW